ncbi:hypothetical protein PV326_009619 [Microctonus aethiopoides]|nr:hypothetical protein PV326_009619 [Microctonus aethiopoides]
MPGKGGQDHISPRTHTIYVCSRESTRKKKYEKAREGAQKNIVESKCGLAATTVAERKNISRARKFENYATFNIPFAHTSPCFIHVAINKSKGLFKVQADCPTRAEGYPQV